MWAGSVGAGDAGDGPAPQPPADDAVVVEDRLAVGGEPHVALEAGGAQAQGERERLERVLGGVGPGAAVGETRSGAGR